MEDTSSATINRSRGSSFTADLLSAYSGCVQRAGSCQELGGIDELANHELELSGRARILEFVHLVESLLSIRHRYLLGDHQRPATNRQNLAQRQQRMRRARTARRGAT